VSVAEGHARRLARTVSGTATVAQNRSFVCVDTGTG